MNYRYFTAPLLIFALACQSLPKAPAQPAVDPAVEAKRAESTVRTFFADIENLDYTDLRNLSTENFQVLNDGTVMDIETLISAFKDIAKVGTITYALDDIQVTVAGSTAWAVYQYQAVMSAGGQEIHLVRLDSAILKKEGIWRLALIHSTEISQETR